MKRTTPFLFALLLTPVAASFAQSPATQPAPRSLADSTILVLPIEPPAGAYAWVGRGIQQDILVDLTQMTRAHVIAPSSAPALDADAALRAGQRERRLLVLHALESAHLRAVEEPARRERTVMRRAQDALQEKGLEL